MPLPSAGPLPSDSIAFRPSVCARAAVFPAKEAYTVCQEMGVEVIAQVRSCVVHVHIVQWWSRYTVPRCSERMLILTAVYRNTALLSVGERMYSFKHITKSRDERLFRRIIRTRASRDRGIPGPRCAGTTSIHTTPG